MFNKLHLIKCVEHCTKQQNTQGTLTIIEYLLGHKANLTKFQSFEFTVCSLIIEFINLALN